MNFRIAHSIAAAAFALTVCMPFALASDAEDLPIPESLIDAPAQVRAGIMRFTQIDLEQWHYTRTRVDEEKTLTDRHDPSLPPSEHWQLVTIDGREPTAAELEKYTEDRADHSNPEEKAARNRITGAILPGSFRLIGREGAAERFAYDLQSPDGKREKSYEKLTGDLVVENSEDGPWVSNVRVWNRETVRPILGLRVDEARIEFQFILEQGYVLPSAVTAQWSGEILMLKEMSQRFEFTLSGFRRAESEAPNTGP